MKIIPVKFIIILSLICILIFPICFYLIGFLVFYLLTLGATVGVFLSDNLCSINSIIKNAINKNGIKINTSSNV